MDEVSKFLFVNLLLPTGLRFKLTPQSSANISYVDMTEEGLVTCLFTSEEDVASLKHALGLPSNQSKAEIRTVAKQQKGLGHFQVVLQHV